MPEWLNAQSRWPKRSTVAAELLHVGFDGHVRPYKMDITAGSGHQIERLACRLLVDVGDRHSGTAAGKAHRDSSSDARCGSRDENRFAAEIVEITVG